MSADEGHSFSLRWRVERQHGLTTVVLTGELDLASGGQLEEATQGLVAEGSVLVFDLQGLEFMDSTGIRILGRLKQEADKDGRRFLLGRISGPVRRVLHIAGLIEYFDYVEGSPPSEVLCKTCDSWVPADAVKCIHCGASL